jgi:hypothetical protein
MCVYVYLPENIEIQSFFILCILQIVCCILQRFLIQNRQIRRDPIKSSLKCHRIRP